jgi:DNA ligase-1
MKPMLAGKVEDVAKLRFPVVVSPKLDGVRAIVKDGVVLSRSLKPIPNKHVQDTFKQFEYMDGELIVGLSTAPDVYRQTVSGVMSEDGTPPVIFCVFDHIQNPELPFDKRYGALRALVTVAGDNRLVRVKQHKVDTPERLLEIEADYTAQGYEGIMVRDPFGQYKFGRSTLNEGWLLKLKRFEDSEAEIVGFEELMHNHNEAKQDELGNTSRSSHGENMVPGNTLGALVCRNVVGDVEFKIGTGFTQQQRLALWERRDQLIGHLVTYKFFPVGVKKAPRHPVFKGFRDRRDI